ncbi:hypothetical protein [Thalassospira sp.]|jgi:hypothetical protein|uniref:hypothetical protein n=1 Tax=Thalassospira sp. TaxID=1912094 RepID=UPI001AFD07EB|nr:hypothetical protein [Thalassospira sp.]MBO6773798.1 hypothetical protein [Thalassospira sp.]|tara:strand:- start:5052 stop:5486 length:435 start_codon:yes stop_codon:yes gene_type:complete
MSEKSGDIYYRVFWYLGFDETSPDWSENSSPDEREEMWFELEKIKIRSVRNRKQFGQVQAVVTGYLMIRHLSVDAKGNFISRPHRDCMVQWYVGGRPESIRPTKVGAFAAAIADIRKDPEFDRKKHQPLINKLLGQKKRVRNAR